jgi:nucleotide-binding universal stress UspA family protein|tara:strand:- start:4200 stop:5084 length:885 start_codon:yes stop_codon:yes gene_type:complete
VNCDSEKLINKGRNLMMNKILVPVDFSEHSEYALEVAAQIAMQQNAELIVVHMLGLSETSMNKDDFQEAREAVFYMKLAEKRFIDFLDKEYLKDLKVTEMVHNYRVFREINDVALKVDANLIVMGSHGSSGFSEVFVGSNTEKVVRSSEVPVLVIKKRRKKFQFENVVFACDFDTQNIKAYRKAMKLCKQFDATVNLLYVNLPAEQFRSSAQMEDRVRVFLDKADNGDYNNLDNVVYRDDYTVENGVFTYSNKINADLIVVSTHGRRGLAHFFFGSIGEDVANHADIPVLTFKI